MERAKKGDTVRIDYTLKQIDGTVLDSTDEKPPMELIVGSGQTSEQFDSAVIDMAPGEEKTRILVAPYGDRQEEMVLDVDRKVFPDDMKLEPGMKIRMKIQGKESVVTLLNVGNDKVRIDANHPLAGKDLIFTCKLVSIEDSAENTG